MSLQIVQQVKADLEARGVSLSGPCGAFEITKRVAWRLGAGYLSKPGGNNCGGYAVDIVCYPDGHIYDILSDGGGTNGPTWQDAGVIDAGRFVRAVPVDVVEPPTPPVEPPVVQEVVLPKLEEIQAEIRDLKATVDRYQTENRAAVAQVASFVKRAFPWIR